MNPRWPMVPLGEVLTHVPRPVNVKPDETYHEIGIRSHGKGTFHKQPVTGMELGNKRVFWIEPGDFVLNIVFAWEGAVAVTGPDEAGMIGSHRFPTFRTDDKRLDARFLLMYFHTRQGMDLLDRVSPGGAGRNRTLSRTAFLGQEMPLPPLREQERIVSVLTRVEAMLAEAQLCRESVGAGLRRLLLSLFAGTVDGAPRKPLGEVAPVVRRPVDVDPLGVYPELGIRSFGKGTFHKAALQGIEVGGKKLFRIEPGDLVFSNVFAWEGAIAVATKGDEGRFGSHRFITCVPRADMATAPFLSFYFSTAEGLSKVGDASPGGAGRNRTLGLDKLSKIDVPLPSIDRQRHFNSVLARAQTASREQELVENALPRLTSVAISRAFRGGL
jgi:type I restriction enzyme, S subunit